MSDSLPQDDPQAENARITELSALRALAEEAEQLLDDKGVFMRSIRAARIQWFGQLMDTRDKHLEERLLAQLRVLDAIPRVIKTATSDHTMAMRRHQPVPRRA
jgi:tRNA1(Val) A37 N6-methylase TrmN6